MLKSIYTTPAGVLIAISAYLGAQGIAQAQETSTWEAIKERGSLYGSFRLPGPNLD